MRRTAPRLLLAAVMTAATVTATAPPAAAEPPFVGWTALLPSLSLPYDPSSADDCVAGRIRCVDKVIRDMTRRFDALVERCDHDAVFSLAYLRTTEEYRRAASTPGFFADPPFVNHEDVLFARYYTAAYDAWHADRIAEVPPAWRVAYDAADRRRVAGSGNLLLGINAHVNRDLAFVLASIGLTAPDGSSRKPDHDQVNVFLNRVTEPMLAEAAKRLDPTMDDAGTPYGLSYTTLMQLLVTWREAAWRNAERLVSAPDRAAQDRVAQEIEDSAAAQARAIVAEYSYVPPVSSSAARDAFCAVHA
jgi:hypothetical protein